MPAATPALAAVGRVPSGLFVVTARRGREETGMLAGWVQQCSFQPPRLTLAVAPDRLLHSWLSEAGATAVVNVLPAGAAQLIAHFTPGFGPGEAAFEKVPLDGEAGSVGPVLADAAAYIEVTVAGCHEAGDHRLVILDVTGGDVRTADPPATHVRESGSHY